MTEPGGGAMWEQVASLPALLRDETGPMESRLRLALATPEIYRLHRVVLLGSGDSHAAALALAPAFAAWSGLPVQAVTAMEGARYLTLGPRPGGVLVVAISNSGEAARVVEAAEQLVARGALVMAMTAAPNGSLAKAAGRVLDVSIAPSRPAPGVRSFLAALLGLALLAIRAGEVKMRMTMDEAQALRKAIAGLAGPMEETIATCRRRLPALAASWSEFTTADIVGSGPEFGVAAYAAAKLIEAAGIHAAPQDAEEFHHLNYYVARRRQTPVVLFQPAGSAAASRLAELRTYLERLDRPRLWIGEGDAEGPNLLRLPTAPALLAPMLETGPAAALAAEWASAAGTTPFRGFVEPWEGGRGSAIVRNSHRLGS